MRDDLMATLAKINKESLLEEYDIKDNADEVAQFCLSLAFYFKQPVDIFLEEPETRMPLYMKEFQRMHRKIEEAKRNAGG